MKQGHKDVQHTVSATLMPA